MINVSKLLKYEQQLLHVAYRFRMLVKGEKFQSLLVALGFTWIGL